MTGKPPSGKPPASKPPAARPPAGKPPATRPPAEKPPSGKPPRRKRVIGVLETVSIPEWRLYGIQARVDTGALTSSIDVPRAVVVEPGDGRRPYAEITAGEGEEARTVKVLIVGFRTVRNPSGHASRRPIVEAVIELGGRRFRTQINLHRREGMTYRMIIGRRALAGRFLVDVARRRRT